MTCFEELGQLKKLYNSKLQELNEFRTFVKNYKCILNDPYLKMLGKDASHLEFLDENEEAFKRREIIEREMCYEKAQYENKICQLNKEIITCCGFDAQWLSKIIAEIMSIFEGKDYIAFIDDGEYKVDLRERLFENRDSCFPINFYFGVVPFYVVNIRDIPFSLYTSILGGLFETSFPYLKEFVDLLIDFRIKNGKQEITDEDLQMLKTTFFESKKDDIRNNYIKNNEKTYFEMEALRSEYMKKINKLGQEIEFRTDALNDGLQVSKQKKLIFESK